MANKTDNIITTGTPRPENSIDKFRNYSSVLETYNLTFEREDNYLFVGEVNWTLGWIIDISVIYIQIADLLETIIPVLIKEKAAFRVVRNLKVASSILSGELGYTLLGKIVSIYPRDENQAYEIVKKIIPLTVDFKGPKILTDRHLGNVIYTRFGACNPIMRTNEKGIQENATYDLQGNLVKDYVTIPFTLPEGINWPFSSMVPSKAPTLETVLQDKYRPMEFLKEDVKGNVKKGLWLERFYRIRWCVIKEGKQNMIADSLGRTAGNRLKWQFELHRNLQEQIPIPKVYDLFEENGDTYLVMQYIKGIALNKIISKFFKGSCWYELPVKHRHQLINYADQLIDAIRLMHKLGYVHRDITTGNFLITKDQKLCMIDLELSYSIKNDAPNPPFRLGTFGFMSPEQEATQMPTFAQDTYAIGGTLLCLFTGLLPDKFTTNDSSILKEQLSFFIDDEKLVSLIVNCFNNIPDLRPSLLSLKNQLKEFAQSQKEDSSPNYDKLSPPDNEKIKNILERSLHGLANSELTNKKNLWFSKSLKEDGLSHQQDTSVFVSVGFGDGLSGIMYLLAQATKTGFLITKCMSSYKKSILFTKEHYEQLTIEKSVGFYHGTSGFALALSEGIESGLIEKDENIIKRIKSYIKFKTITENEIAEGISGIGLIVLKIKPLIGQDFATQYVEELVSHLLKKQQKDGSWLVLTDHYKDPIKITGLSYGVSGIICFLLSYLNQYRNVDVEVATIKAIEWLIKQRSIKKQQFSWYINNKVKEFDTGLLNGVPGIILTLVKAYEVLKKTYYKDLAEEIMKTIPHPFTNSDITLANGLVGLGELYIEAAKVFNNYEWGIRASWIAAFLLHNFRQQKDGSLFWEMNEASMNTAGLMKGNSGVIHFLLRYYQQGKLTHPLLLF